MGLLEKIDRRTGVMTRMADTLGADFAATIAQRPEAVRDYRQAVMRCTGCGHEGECTAWMQSHPQAEEAPDYCRNKDILESLAKA